MMATKLPKKVRLNKSTVAGIAPPKTGRTYVYDTKVHGLAVCVTVTTHRSTWSSDRHLTWRRAAGTAMARGSGRPTSGSNGWLT